MNEHLPPIRRVVTGDHAKGNSRQENRDLEALAKDKVYTFLYVYSPTPVAGATGSIGAPLAIR
jgi:hypothetical protein